MTSEAPSGPDKELQRLIQAWQDGAVSPEERDALCGMLRENYQARESFLESMNLEALLFWKYAAQRDAAAMLIVEEDGATRPIASIVEGEFAFCEDPAFQLVSDRLGERESHSHLWLQLYPRIRASVFLCVPASGAGERIVSAICDDVNESYDRNASLTAIRSHACQASLKRLKQSLRRFPSETSRPYLRLASEILREDASCDPLVVYESVEAYIPHVIRSDLLHVLLLRYLLEFNTARIAELLGLTESDARKRLARARLLTWKLCVEHSGPEAPQDTENALLLVNECLDRSPASPQALRSLTEWLCEGGDRRRRFVTFCLLHEALYRQLSLGALFEELGKRKDIEFRRVVEGVVHEIEIHSRISAPSPGPVPLKKEGIGKYSPAAAAATAALLLLGVTLGFWMLRGPAAPPPDDQVAVSPPPVAPPPELPIVAAPDPPPVVGVVSMALDIDADAPQRHRVGDSVRVSDVIAIEKGMVQLVTTSGNVWVLEAPVRAVIDGQDQLSLESGKVVGRNSDHQRPLLVRTPQATVRDLGTEFGVGVSEDASMSVAVYEGEIEVESGAASSPASPRRPLSVAAGFRAQVGAAGGLPVSPEPLLHDRGFVRPDELQLRQLAKSGSAEAADKVAFYELLRIDGLLAYQGFHAGSNAEDFAFGFASPALRAANAYSFGPNLEVGSWSHNSDALVVRGSSSVYLDLDVGEHSPLALAGLLDASNKAGRRDGEIWVSWKSRSLTPPNKRAKWTGLSMMFGDERGDQEPLFIGQPTDLQNLGVHIFTSGGDAEDLRFELDTDPLTPGTQPLASNSAVHSWVVQLQLQQSGRARARVWCDVNKREIAATPEQLQHDFPNFSFDRFRLEVSADDAAAACAFDEIVVATTLDSLRAVEDLSAD